MVRSPARGYGSIRKKNCERAQLRITATTKRAGSVSEGVDGLRRLRFRLGCRCIRRSVEQHLDQFLADRSLQAIGFRLFADADRKDAHIDLILPWLEED